MQKRRILTVVLAIGILFIWRQIHVSKRNELIHLTGTTMGVIDYSVKYLDDQERNFQYQIDSILEAFNNSLSTYIPDSELSTFNKLDTVRFVSPFIYPVFSMSFDVYTQTKGAFDPTVGTLVNAWGFGQNKNARMDSAIVDSLKQYVGFDQVRFDESGASKPKGVVLDFSASAKGFAIDVVADWLSQQGLFDYMVEIGGEVTCKGRNQDGNVWKIGIEKPSMSSGQQALFATTFVNNKSIATSGNYRNYYKENGRIISHTIDPFTGFPAVQNLLSASIYADNCTLADGYATACMVMGLDKSIEMIERLPELDGFLIFSDNSGKLQWYASSGIANQIEVLD